MAQKFRVKELSIKSQAIDDSGIIIENLSDTTTKDTTAFALGLNPTTKKIVPINAGGSICDLEQAIQAEIDLLNKTNVLLTICGSDTSADGKTITLQDALLLPDYVSVITTYNFVIDTTLIGDDDDDDDFLSPPDDFLPPPDDTDNENDYTFYTSQAGLNIDWGDGNNTISVSGDNTHTYSSSGIYTIKLEATTGQIRHNIAGMGGKITDVSHWGASQFSAMNSMFSNCTSLVGFTATDIPNTSSVININSMFNGASAFNQDIGSWNTSNVTDMNTMFNNATVFNQNLTGRCVTLIPSLPLDFDIGSALAIGNRPVRGTCP